MKNRIGTLAVIMAFWFSISFISNLLGPLIPDIIHNFNLKDMRLAGLIPSSFFFAYAVMSIPSGILIEKYGEKKILLIGFSLQLFASILFAIVHTYPMLLISCFLIGIGMTMLQTILNPLQRIVGGEKNHAFVGEVAQFIFGIASFLSPLLYSYLVTEMNASHPSQNFLIQFLSTITPSEMPWVSLYWIITILLLIMLIAVFITSFPHIDPIQDKGAHTSRSYRSLFKQKTVGFFFLGIFSYVSAEQSISIFMSTFLEKYHHINPQIEGARTISFFWGAMTLGCIVGMIALKFFNSKKLLRISGFLASLLLIIALSAPKAIAIIAFPSIGFSISMMFSIVFSLALNSVSQNHGTFAGILCSAISGGAIGPLLITLIADYTSLRFAMFFILIYLLYITSIGYWAKPLIENKTIQLKEVFKKRKRN